MSTNTGIPFHVMKEIIENLKALEALDEARRYLMPANTDPFEVYPLLRGAKYNFERPFFFFDNNSNVEKEMSQELTAIVHTLQGNVRDCLTYQNAPSTQDKSEFFDDLRERGYIAGIKRSPHDTLRAIHYINTKHGLFLIS